MKIGGLQKVSLIDYPGKIASVIFTQGCNFCCQFCHNPSLVLSERFEKALNEDEVFEFLGSRKNRIDAVVVSGGEPTLHKDLPEFLQKIKSLGFLVKLDTNGTNPEMLTKLYSCGLLDYVAMDIKHVFEKYSEIVTKNVDIDKIKKSIDLIIASGVWYEFRTTIVPEFHTVDDIKLIVGQVKGADRFAIQEFVADHAINKNLSSKNSIFDLENKLALDELVEFCKSQVKNLIVHRAK